MIMDTIFVCGLVAIVIWGMSVGFLGAVIWCLAVWLSIAVSAQLVGRIFPNLGLPEGLAAVLTSVGYAIVSGVVIFFASIAAEGVRTALSLTPLEWVDRFGGAIFGLLLGLVGILAFIAIAATMTYVIPDDASGPGSVWRSMGFAQSYLEGPRRWLDDQMTHSLIVKNALLVRPPIVPFAPDEIGIATEVLKARMN